MAVQSQRVQLKLHLEGFAVLLQEAAVFLSFTYLLLFNGAAASFLNEPLLKVTFGLLTLTALGWWIAGQSAPTPCRYALLAFLLVYGLSCLTSLDPRRSFEDFGWLLFVVFLFALFADLAARGWSRARMLRGLLTAAALITAIAWLNPIQWYLGWRAAHPGEWLPDVVYRFPSANTLAIFLNVALMLALALLLHSRSRLSKALLSALAAAMLGLLLLTSSRSGWLGFGAGVVCMAILWTRRSPPDWRSAWSGLGRRPALLILAAVILLTALAVGGWVLFRFTQHPSHGSFFESRSQFWPPAWNAFLLRPILGQGPNTISAALLAGSTLPAGQVYVHAHNTPLHLLVSSGILGGLAGLGLAASFVTALRRRWQEVSSSAGIGPAAVLASCAALAAFAVEGLFDVFYLEPIGIWLLAALVGTSLGKPAAAVVKKPSWLRRPWWGLGLAGLAWVSLWLTQPLFAGVEAASKSDMALASQHFALAAQRDPTSAVAWQQWGLAESFLAEQGVPGALERSAAAFERSADLDPAWALNHANLAVIYVQQGKGAQALEQMQAAVSLSPDALVLRLNLAYLLESQGQAAQAESEYRAVLAALPYTPLGNFWRESPLRRAVWEQYAQQDPSLLTIAEAEAALRANPSSVSAYLPLARAYLWARQPEKAAQALEDSRFAAAVSSAETVEVTRLWAQIEAQRGNVEAEQAYRRQFEFACQMQGLAGPLDSATQRYAALAFRKPAMFVELAPQLVRVPCE